MIDIKADKQQAIVWARNLLKGNFWILDTETTGLTDKAEACEIGIINNQGQIIFDQRIKVKDEIDSGATAVHGITNKDLENCLTFPDYYETLYNFLSSQKILIYNKNFDLRILRQQCDRHKLKRFEIDSKCFSEIISPALTIIF